MGFSLSFRLYRVVAAVLSLLVVSGCREIEETENPLSRPLTDLGATSDPSLSNTSLVLSRVQFDDIPVPPGFFFRNQRNESFGYEDGDARVGRFVYWGRKPREEVVALYLEKMPKDPYNWSLASGGDGADTPLIFKKPGQTCEIRLLKERHRPRGGLLLTISVEGSRLHDHEEP